MRRTYVFEAGQVVPKETRANELRSQLACPMVISDTLSDVINPVDGKPYDSKSNYYRAVKDHGCVIVGNEAEKMMNRSYPKPNVREADVGEALRKVRAGYKPRPEAASKTELEIAGLR